MEARDRLTNDPTLSGVPERGEANAPSRVVRMLLGTERDWIASDIGKVLEPERFVLLRAESTDQLFHLTAASAPDIVLLDGDLRGRETASLCDALLSGPLSRRVPLVVYTSKDFAEEEARAEIYDAGAWSLLEGPIRTERLVPTLRRLLAIGKLAVPKVGEGISDPDTGLLNRAGLRRTAPLLGALADRQGATVTCAVVGPTRPGTGEVLQRQRKRTAHLCSQSIRRSDLCGWVSDGDLAILAYDTPLQGASALVERLNALAAGQAEVAPEPRTLSAGIGEMNLAEEEAAGTGAEPGQASTTPRDPEPPSDLPGLAAAQAALRAAREAGGGIRFT